MATHYKIVFSGDGIVFDNYGSPEPVIGFVACRLIEAETEKLAIATAKRNILVQWNQSFNADRKIGLPKLTVEHVATVSALFTRKPKNDYYFFVCPESKQTHLKKLTQGRSFRLWHRRQQ